MTMRAQVVVLHPGTTPTASPRAPLVVANDIGPPGPDSPAWIAPPITIEAVDPSLQGPRVDAGTGRLIALLVVSFFLHGAFIAALWHKPQPLESVGLPAISVDIILGGNTPAGVAQERSEEARNAPVDVARPEAPPQETPATQVEPDAARPVQADVAQQSPHEDQKPEAAPEQPETEVSQTQPEATPQTTPTEATEQAHRAEEAHPAAQTHATDEAHPHVQSPTARAVPVMRPAKPPLPQRPEVTREARPKPKQDDARTRHTTETTRTGKPTTTAARTNSASGVGVGRSSANPNYYALVAAHLARHKQFPSDARSRSDQGRAVVTFGLDGGGRVTFVRLTRGSGVPSLDQETQAMVRRASPFPAPPSGQAMTFTVPVNFQIR